VIIFLDEPYLTSLGSAFVSLPPEKVRALLEETLGGISGLRGVHCCGNTDWSLLLGLPINILSFDAYNYAGALSAYAAEVRSFIGNGGAVAWGIIPNDEDHLAKESASSLKDRLEEAMAPFAKELPSGGWWNNSSSLCGLASLSPAAAGELWRIWRRSPTKCADIHGNPERSIEHLLQEFGKPTPEGSAEGDEPSAGVSTRSQKVQQESAEVGVALYLPQEWGQGLTRLSNRQTLESGPAAPRRARERPPSFVRRSLRQQRRPADSIPKRYATAAPGLVSRSSRWTDQERSWRTWIFAGRSG
jgi:hypothetical protein